MTMHSANARTILAEALASEIGIRVRIQSTKPIPGMTFRAKKTLYRFRRQNSEFMGLQIKFCPHDPDNFLWIIKSDFIDIPDTDPDSEDE